MFANIPFTDAPVALIIFITTIAFSLYTMYSNQSMYERFQLHPWKVMKEKQWHLLFTSGFLHADTTHLLFNMLTFLFFAFTLEAYFVGSFNFLIIYFGSMILSDISTVIKHKEDPYYRAVGASGAISGVLFSFILFQPLGKIYIYFAIGIPAFVFAILYLLYSYFAAKRSGDFINHEAHLWGAVAGLALTIILIPESLEYFVNQIF